MEHSCQTNDCDHLTEKQRAAAKLLDQDQSQAIIEAEVAELKESEIPFMYKRFYDLRVYNEDGSLDSLATIRNHIGFYSRSVQRWYAKNGIPVDWAPSNPVGRNDPCPCGSGLKSKRCCINRRKENDSADMPVLQQEAHSTLPTG